MGSRTGGVAGAGESYTPPGPAGVAESHSAVVLFMADHAYKIKKPVDFGFLNFTTTDAREAACRREVALNRRLAPDVYLDVARVLDGDGGTCDWVVVMWRMPASRRLSTLIEQQVDVRDDLKQLARMLASFHSTARRGPEIDAAGSPSALRKRWIDNFAGAADYVDDVLDRELFTETTTLALRYVDGRARLLDERTRGGHVVDGHGDLQAEDIFCLDDGPRVLDCLEFDDALRYVDGLDDVAFLAMDLERLGAPQAADQFLHWYREFSGGQVPASLMHHYIAYRAFVRAKVACLRHSQGVSKAASEARHLARIALAHLRTGQVQLLLVGGLPGTGKSTIATEVADGMGAVVLRTDQIRRELPGAADLSGQAGYGRELYAHEQVHKTYAEMLSRARILLEHGESVVLDASWSSADERETARAVGQETHTSVTELRCVAPPEVTAPRIANRVGDASEATVEVSARMERDFTAWPESIPIDTSGPVHQSVSAARAAVDTQK